MFYFNLMLKKSTSRWLNETAQNLRQTLNIPSSAQEYLPGEY